MEDAGSEMLNAQWDQSVDVLCYGVGFGVLASAIAAADAGNSALVVHPGLAAPTDAAPTWPAHVEDPRTREYFDSLIADTRAPDGAAADSLTVRTVTKAEVSAADAAVEPFYGARLLDWASRCLMSSHGVLHTGLPDQAMAVMKSDSGEQILVQTVGSFDPEPGTSAVSAIGDWFADEIHQRDIDVVDGGALQRIVFEDGRVIGAVIATADGVSAIRVVHGIAVSTGATVDDTLDWSFESTDRLLIALVGRTASRFGRVELLKFGNPALSTRSPSHRPRRLRNGMPGPGRSIARSCRETHRRS